MPEVGADGERHCDPVTLIVRATRRVAIRHARQVVAYHFLIVLETTAGEDDTLSGLYINRFAILLSGNADDLPSNPILDEAATRRFVKHLDRSFLYQTMETFPGERIAIGRSIMEFVDAV